MLGEGIKCKLGEGERQKVRRVLSKVILIPDMCGFSETHCRQVKWALWKVSLSRDIYGFSF